MERAERERLLSRARALEQGGDVDGCVRAYVQAEAREEASRVLAAAKRFVEAADVLLAAIPQPFDQWSQLDHARRKHALMAAIHLNRAGEVARAVEVFLALGEHQRAADALRRAGDPVTAARIEAGERPRSLMSALGSSTSMAQAKSTAAVSAVTARGMEQRGKLEEALEQYTQLRLFGDAGRVAFQLQRFELAAKLLSEGGMPYEAAHCFLKLGDLASAQANLLRVPRQHPRYRSAAVDAARTAHALDQVAFELDVFLGDFVRAGPQSEAEGEALYLLARLYERHNLLESARDVVAAVAAVAPGYRDVRAWLEKLDATIRAAPVGDKVLEEQMRFWGTTEKLKGAPTLVVAMPELPDLPDLPVLPDLSRPSSPSRNAPPAPAPARAPATTPVSRRVDASVEQAHVVTPPTQEGNAFRETTGNTLLVTQGSQPPTPPVVEALPAQPALRAAAPTPAPMPALSSRDVFEIGAVLHGRYRLDELVGRGGMAVVFKAFDLELSEHLAVKVFTQALQEPELIARFRQELKLARQLLHPNVVRLYDIGVIGDYRYLTMELLIGEDLFSRMQKPLTLDEGLDYLIQACAGLQAAHEKGVIHRDVKSENFFITQERVLKVLDFGVAKQGASRLTVMGTIGGTPQYISPEQINNFGAVGPSADIYSLGVVAYHMCTGRLPFDHEELGPLLMMHLMQAPAPPRQLNPGLPIELERLILATLEKDPAKRPASCTELAQHLMAVRKAIA